MRRVYEIPIVADLAAVSPELRELVRSIGRNMLGFSEGVQVGVESEIGVATISADRDLTQSELGLIAAEMSLGLSAGVRAGTPRRLNS